MTMLYRIVCFTFLAMGRLRAFSMIPLSLMFFLLILVEASTGLVLCNSMHLALSLRTSGQSMATVFGVRYELHSIYAPRRYRYTAYAENAKARSIAVQVCPWAFVLTKVSRSLPPHIDLVLRPP